MPFFHYVANDQKGAQVEGTVQASNTEEASRVLAQRGFKVLAISDLRRPSIPAVFRTKRGSDRQRFFLFAQIANLLKAGVNPADGFTTLAAQTPHEGFKESLRRIAATTGEGASISQVMSMYPDLYPEHVVGLVHAGEVGGFVPEACAAVSEQAGSAHKFRFWHWFLWVAVIAFVFAALLTYVGSSALEATFVANWNDPSTAKIGSLSTYFDKFKAAWVQTPGIITISVWAGLAVGLWFWGRPAARKLRHTLGLKYPGYGKRASHENVTIFCWALGLLSRGGVPPNTAWELSARCAPNLAMQERLLEAGRRMQSNSRVSEAVFGAKLFPPDYAPIVSTGEMTGDLPGALERLAQISRGDFDTQSNYMRVRTGCSGCLIFVIGSLAVSLGYYFFYSKIMFYIMEHGAD